MQHDKEAILKSVQGSLAIEGMHLTDAEIARACGQLDGTLSVDDAIAEVHRELKAHKAATHTMNQSDAQATG